MTESFLDRWSKVIDDLPLSGTSRQAQIAAIIEVTVLAERERCAKIAEQKMIEWKDFRGGKELEASFKINAARQIAAAIRAVPPQQEEPQSD